MGAMAIIICIGSAISLFVFAMNKLKDSRTDNAKWESPLLYALQAYDLFSDVNLSYDIFMNVTGFDIIFWCGIGSVLSTVIPYSMNLIYAIRIKKQDTIKNNKHADAYFTSK